MYTREEILKSFKEVSFPSSIFDESTLANKKIIFYPKSFPPKSSINKDITSLSESYVLPWRYVQQKNNINNKKNIEFSRGGSFFSSELKEPLIEIKIENFKKIYEKFGIPLDKKIIYLKKGNYIFGPYNYDELENMYKNKKFDSNYEFRTIDLFTYSEEEPFIFHPLKNINEDNWEINYVDTPLLEYSALYSKVKELLDASKKRKVEINTLNDEINELKIKHEEKDNTIIELNQKIEKLEKELSIQKEQKEQKEENIIKEPEKEEIKEELKEDIKEEDKPVVKEEIVEVVEKNFLYSVNNNKKKRKKKKKGEIKEDPDEEDEKEVIVEKEKIEIEFKPKVLDMGEEWEIAGKKKKKIEKINEEQKIVVKKEEPKKNTTDLTKSTGSNKSKKNTNPISGDELVEMLRPKKKEVVKNEIKNEVESSNAEVKQVKGKGKKKNKRQYEDINIDLGFKY